MSESEFSAVVERAGSVAGESGLVFVAPHAEAPFERVLPFLRPDAPLDAVRAYVEDWHDLGSGEALDAALATCGARGFGPVVPRGLLDLNRGRARPEAQETLFGKGPISSAMREWLAEGSDARLESARLAAMAELSAATRSARALVELHSYGDLGSSYDRDAGGRPVRRPEACVVTATPWATPRPVGLARLIPGDLACAPWRAQRVVLDALDAAGFAVGPHPYPQQGPWALSARFVAARWFRWLGSTGRLPVATAAILAELAWLDEQAIAIGALEALPGVGEVARLTGEWSHAAGDLAAEFTASQSGMGLTVELRVDKQARAPALGEAVARALVSL